MEVSPDKLHGNLYYAQNKLTRIHLFSYSFCLFCHWYWYSDLFVCSLRKCLSLSLLLHCVCVCVSLKDTHTSWGLGFSQIRVSSKSICSSWNCLACPGSPSHSTCVGPGAQPEMTQSQRQLHHCFLSLSLSNTHTHK